jgi:primase-polymerase (primpol)-like protein
LKERSTWVCWQYEWKPDREKWTKLPVNPSNGRLAKSNDSDAWADFETVKAYHEHPDIKSDGVGFMFDPEGLVVGIDLDDVRDSETGRPNDTAKDIIRTLNSFTEVSPSGTGYHILLYGTLPTQSKNRRGSVEIYEQGRFFTVTGDRVDGTPATVNRRQESLEAVHREYLVPDDQDQEKREAKSPTEPTTLSDQKLIKKAKRADSGEKFTRLWNGNAAGYESHSEADLALCCQLLWWTQGDKRRADRLFRQSGLYRENWERDDYREETLAKADQRLTDYYDPTHGTQDGTHALDLSDSVSDATHSETTLTPAHVVTRAGLDPEDYDSHAEAISKLNDREKAAVVWELLRESDQYHVRVRRDNSALYGYDNGVWVPDGERTLRHAAREALGASNYGKNVLAELKTQVRGDPMAEVPSEAWGLDSGYLAVANGLLDLEAAGEGN